MPPRNLANPQRLPTGVCACQLEHSQTSVFGLCRDFHGSLIAGPLLSILLATPYISLSSLTETPQSQHLFALRGRLHNLSYGTLYISPFKLTHTVHPPHYLRFESDRKG